jgi:tetratricopeptide (TPR) repeat protein
MTIRTNIKRLFTHTFLIIFGFCLFLILLEVSLRCASLFFIHTRTPHFAAETHKKITLLCLGESTTYQGYPQFLERYLNTHSLYSFRVIDAGVPGTNSAQILARLPKYLKDFNPDIVIGMIGINDAEDTISYTETFWDSLLLTVQRLRVYKVIWIVRERLLSLGFNETPLYAEERPPSTDNADTLNQKAWEHMQKKEFEKAEELFTVLLNNDPTNERALIDLSLLYIQTKNKEKARATLEKVHAINPDFHRFLYAQGNLFVLEEKYTEALETFMRALTAYERDPIHTTEYTLVKFGISDCLLHLGKYDESKKILDSLLPVAIDTAEIHKRLADYYAFNNNFDASLEELKKRVALNPDNIEYLRDLGNRASEDFRFDIAINCFEKIYNRDHMNPDYIFWLANIYSLYGQMPPQEKTEYSLRQLQSLLDTHPHNTTILNFYTHLLFSNQRYKEAEELLMPAIFYHKDRYRAEPTFDTDYDLFSLLIRLGNSFIGQERWIDAEKILHEAIHLIPNQPEAYTLLALVLRKQNKHLRSNIYTHRAARIRNYTYSKTTHANYNRIKNILQEHSLPFVAVQYPLRPVHTLKKLLGSDETIYYVDNEALFKDAIQRASFTDYFRDFFAGDFGHCTDKGNKLLAENIGRTILTLFPKK